MRQAPKRGNHKGVRYKLRSPATSFPTTEPKASSEPMQLGVSRLSDEERIRRHQLQLCFYCGEAGHRSVGCPHKSKNAQRVTIEHFSLLNNKSFLLPVTVNTEDISLELTAMIDSGAALNLISKSIVKEYNLPTQPCIPPDPDQSNRQYTHWRRDHASNSNTYHDGRTISSRIYFPLCCQLP